MPPHKTKDRGAQTLLHRRMSRETCKTADSQQTSTASQEFWFTRWEGNLLRPHSVTLQHDLQLPQRMIPKAVSYKISFQLLYKYEREI